MQGDTVPLQRVKYYEQYLRRHCHELCPLPGCVAPPRAHVHVTLPTAEVIYTLDVLGRDVSLAALEAFGQATRHGPLWRAVVHLSWFWVAERAPKVPLAGWRNALYDPDLLRGALGPVVAAVERQTLRWFPGPMGPCGLTFARALNAVQRVLPEGLPPVSVSLFAVALWKTYRSDEVATCKAKRLEGLPLRAELRDVACGGALLTAAPSLLSPSQLALRAAILNGVNVVFVTQSRTPAWRAPLGALHALLLYDEAQCAACWQGFRHLAALGLEPTGSVTCARDVAATLFGDGSMGAAAAARVLRRVAFDAGALGLLRGTAPGSDWAWVVVGLMVEAMAMSQAQVQTLVAGCPTWGAVRVLVPVPMAAPAAGYAPPGQRQWLRPRPWARTVLSGMHNPAGLRGLADMASLATVEFRVPLDKACAEGAYAGLVFGVAPYAPGDDTGCATAPAAVGPGAAGSGGGGGGEAAAAAAAATAAGGSGATAGGAPSVSVNNGDGLHSATASEAWFMLASGGPFAPNTSNIGGVYGTGFRHTRRALRHLDKVVALLDVAFSRPVASVSATQQALAAACVLMDPATNDVWTLEPCGPQAALKKWLQAGLAASLRTVPWCLVSGWTSTVTAALWWWMLDKVAAQDPVMPTVMCLAMELCARRPRCSLLLTWGAFIRIWRRLSPIAVSPTAAAAAAAVSAAAAEGAASAAGTASSTTPVHGDDVDQAPFMRVVDAACGAAVVPRALVPRLLPEYTALARATAVHDCMFELGGLPLPCDTQLAEEVLYAAVMRFVFRADWRAARAIDFIKTMVQLAQVGVDDDDDDSSGEDGDREDGERDGGEREDGERDGGERDDGANALRVLHTWCDTVEAPLFGEEEEEGGATTEDDLETNAPPLGHERDAGVEGYTRMWSEALRLTASRGSTACASTLLYAHPACLVSTLVQRFASMVHPSHA